jgi:ABC-type branched-subunit amino acid transport system substrate-binding protein
LVIKDSSRYADSLSRSLISELSNNGFVDHKVIEFGSNLAAEIENIKPDLVVFAGYYEEGSSLINAMRNSDIKIPILLTDGCFPAAIFKKIKVDPGEVYISFIAPDWAINSQANEMIVEAKKQSRIDLSYAPFAADSYHIIYDAARQILGERNNRLDRKMLLEYFKKHREFSDKSYIAGPYIFGNNGDNTRGRNHIYRMISKDNSKFWEFMQTSTW